MKKDISELDFEALAMIVGRDFISDAIEVRKKNMAVTIQKISVFLPL